jgi:hypothetical protein
MHNKYNFKNEGSSPRYQINLDKYDIPKQKMNIPLIRKDLPLNRFRLTTTETTPGGVVIHVGMTVYKDTDGNVEISCFRELSDKIGEVETYGAILLSNHDNGYKRIQCNKLVTEETLNMYCDTAIMQVQLLLLILK